MTAFLFIPPSEARFDRRIDLAGMARRFAEPDEPVMRSDTRGMMMQVAMAILIMIGAIGDTVLIARPGMTDSVASTHRPAGATESRPISF